MASFVNYPGFVNQGLTNVASFVNYPGFVNQGLTNVAAGRGRRRGHGTREMGSPVPEAAAVAGR